MTGRQAIAITVLAMIVSACGADAEPGPSPTAAPDPTASQGALVVEPSADPATPSPKPTPKSIPKPTPVPVPPKPTRLRLSEEIEGISSGPDDMAGIGDSVFTLHWKAPRTPGVQIRVFGVTACFPGDYPMDRKCLRKHTALPDDVRVLLAKAPASRGKVSWREGTGYEEADGCVFAHESANGTAFYSVVVAAYSSSGHSIFAIVDAGWKDPGCFVETG